MKTVFTFLSIGLALVITGASVTRAEDGTRLATSPPLLSASLISDRGLKEEFLSQHVGYPGDAFGFDPSVFVCRDLHLECLAVSYLDDPAAVAGIYPEETGFRNVQIELQTLLAQDGQLAHICRAQDWDSVVSCGSVKDFKHAGLFDPTFLEKKSDQTFSKKLEGPELLERDLLRNPPSFRKLPEMLATARKENSPHAGVLERTVKDALLLTLNALVPGADSTNPTYPFEDQFVSRKSLIQIAPLYHKLAEHGQWPEVVDLSEKDRETLGGIYRQHSDDGKRWKVKGFYDERANVIRLDLTADFYENIYVYFHELWHVAWSHSTYNQDQLKAIVALLAEPDAPENRQNLRKKILQYLSENEFLAIDQQVRLFRAVGIQTQAWDHSSLPSALQWHDSYLGDESYRLAIPQALRKNLHVTGPEIAMPVDLVTDLVTYGMGQARKKDARVAEAQLQSEKHTLDHAYWQARMAAHARLFEKAYFGETLGTVEDKNPISAEQLLSGDFGPVYVPQLSCEQIRRVKNALGDDWQFGFPFHYETIASDSACAGDPSDGPVHPSNEGTHGDLDAFPSLDAPQDTSRGPSSVSDSVSNGCLDDDSLEFLKALVDDLPNSTGNGCWAFRGFFPGVIELKLTSIATQADQAGGNMSALGKTFDALRTNCRQSSCGASSMRYAYRESCVLKYIPEIKSILDQHACPAGHQ